MDASWNRRVLFFGQQCSNIRQTFEEEELCVMLDLGEHLPCIIAATFCDVSRSHWQTRQVMRYTTVLQVCWWKKNPAQSCAGFGQRCRTFSYGTNTASLAVATMALVIGNIC